MKRYFFLIAIILAALVLPVSSQTNKQNLANASAQSRQTLETLEKEWADAVKCRDVEAIERIQSADFTFTDPAGQVWTKTREIETIKAGDLQINSFDMSEVNVRVYQNTAVVTFRIVWQGRFRNTDISGPQRMTDVFVKRDGRWQCVASQATRILQR